MMELTDKDIETAVINVLCVLKNAEDRSRALEVGAGTMESFSLSDTPTPGAGVGQEPEVLSASLSWCGTIISQAEVRAIGAPLFSVHYAQGRAFIP